MIFEPISNRIIGSALEVHKELGPGLLESVYEQALKYELTVLGIPFESQLALPLFYKNKQLDCGFRIDLLVDKQVVVEIKSVEALVPIHEAQLLSYMKLSRMKIGLLINFNVKLLKDGIKRFVL